MIKDKKIKDWYHKQQDRTNNHIIKILNVDYAHLILSNKDDLYVTSYGLPFLENLKPENYWLDKDWFEKKSQKLNGTSTVYKIRTKKVCGREKDIVIKWNRMGQDIPVATECDDLNNSEFNSPFEEFSLVFELRKSLYPYNSNNIIIQKPLAIYTPYKKIDLWRLGRKEYKIKEHIKSHQDIKLDMFRSYAVIYEWINGIDAVEAYEKKIIDDKYMKSLTLETEYKINTKGFTVHDKKPHHIIVRYYNNKLKTNNKGKPLNALIDFELLKRTLKNEKNLKELKRHDYHVRQRDRFHDDDNTYHPHLKHVNVLGVHYIFGHVESTKGNLWVVGDDPYLYDYFLPERWEKTSRTRLSQTSQVYHTVSKDDIHFVWKVSKVGTEPNLDPFKESEKKILDFGYNSPFEEFSIANYLNENDIPTIYPRAIYMTGYKTKISHNFTDNRRFNSHKNILTPNGHPILKNGRDYIVIWGFWNGPDEKIANKDGDFYKAINALQAFKNGIISEKKYFYLLKSIRDRLLKIGIEDLNLTGTHFLIATNGKGNLILDKNGVPEIRISNFQFLKKK